MKVFIVTGGSDGIGAEIARQLAATHGAGCAIALGGRSREKLAAVAAACESHGARTLCVAHDVGVQADCRRLVEETVAAFSRIDALINNAGMSAQALFEDVEDLGWYEDLMRINLWGSVWCTQAALPHLKASRGHIVAVSSLAGLVGVPGRTAYSASKFAMTGFFEALRAELKRSGVSVTTAYPGVVSTQIRYRGFNAEGKPAGKSGLKEEGAMRVEECARLIIAGMNGRKREVVMTFKGKLGRILKIFAPGSIERVALAALKEDVRPR